MKTNYLFTPVLGSIAILVAVSVVIALSVDSHYEQQAKNQPPKDFIILHESTPEGWYNATVYVLLHKGTGLCYAGTSFHAQLTITETQPLLCKHYERVEKVERAK